MGHEQALKKANERSTYLLILLPNPPCLITDATDPIGFPSVTSPSMKKLCVFCPHF
jgi:hypothetical protein